MVWVGCDGIDDEIYLYRISTATLVNLSNNDGNRDACPQIHGDYVFWGGFDGNDEEIYLAYKTVFSWPMFLPAITSNAQR